MLFTLPWWWAGGRWRRLWLLLPLWGLAAFFLFNIWYHRVFYDFIPASSVFNTKCFNSLVFTTIPSLIRWRDWLVITILIITTIAIFWPIRGSSPRGLNRSLRILGTSLSIIGFGTMQVYLHHQTTQEVKKNPLFDDSQPLNLYTQKFTSTLKIELASLGVPVYLLKNTVLYFYESYIGSLTPSEIESINSFISSEKLNIPSSNHDKNLILIIVESLNGDAIGKIVDGRSITPTLDSLRDTAECLIIDSLICQIKDGGSSDGQLMYNTGLLPLKSGAASLLFGTNDFPGLPKILNFKESIELICEMPRVWNHTATTLAFGYDTLISLSSSNADLDKDFDRRVFFKATKELQKLKRPFLATITTLSMHRPFKDEAVEDVTALVPLPEMERHYYNSLHYFDTHLGEFITWLRQVGIYNQSIIVIVGDHEVTFNNDKDLSTVGCYILNGGIKGHVAYPVGQIDLYPTLLTLLGYQNNSWKGLGSSIFEGPRPVRDRRGRLYLPKEETQDDINRCFRAWEVSDTIIRSDYFRTYESYLPKIPH